jgi:phosphoglycerol transferase MdoB-like AlkP superfamily enzyme
VIQEKSSPPRRTFRVPLYIRQFVQIYLAAIVIFGAFRLVLFLTYYRDVTVPMSLGDILFAFLMGVRFDVVVSGYILILPFTLLALASIFGLRPRPLEVFVFYLIYIAYAFGFLVAAIDIPYFHQFFARFTVSGFEWLSTPLEVVKMIIGEFRYWIYIVPFILSLVIFYKLLRKIWTAQTASGRTEHFIMRIVSASVFFVLMLIGIRGRLEEKSPIRTGTAYFSDNAFLNMLGLNPNFTLIRSYLDELRPENQRIAFMDDAEALQFVQQSLGISNPDPLHPLARFIAGDSASAKPNIVLVIMESMSAAKMKRHGNTENLTPFLDSISHHGLYFENIYSAGIHTYNGVFSTLTSFPAIFRRHPMKESALLPYHGIAVTLKSLGYSTSFFMAHDGNFDNIEGFCYGNGFEKVFEKQDYPSEYRTTTWGIPDENMFDFSLPKLNTLASKGKPFFAAYLTITDHGPYYIPDHFHPHSSNIKKQVTEYADHALRKFITESSKQPWFANTIFVFIADHGAPIDNTYEMSLDYNHTPLLFYSPSLLKEPRSYQMMGGQIDLYPTLMGLLGLPYVNYSLGIDLLREKRPYIFCNADDKYGVLDNDWFLLVREDKTTMLYKYRSKDRRDYAKEYPDVVTAMKRYAEANLQTFQYLVSTRKQF